MHPYNISKFFLWGKERSEMSERPASVLDQTEAVPSPGENNSFMSKIPASAALQKCSAALCIFCINFINKI